MKLLSLFGAFLGAFFRSFFCKSDGERAGAAETKASILAKQQEVYKAMRDVDYPSTSEKLDKTLRGGKL